MDPSAGFLIVTWKRLTVHSARCYIIATRLLGDNDVSGDVLSIWRRTTTSSDPPGGSEDFFLSTCSKLPLSLLLLNRFFAVVIPCASDSS